MAPGGTFAKRTSIFPIDGGTLVAPFAGDTSSRANGAADGAHGDSATLALGAFLSAQCESAAVAIRSKESSGLIMVALLKRVECLGQIPEASQFPREAFSHERCKAAIEAPEEGRAGGRESR